MGGAAADKAHRQHRGIVRRHVARHHRLQRRHDGRRRRDRIARAVRHGAVPAHALDGHVGHVGRQAHRAGQHAEGARRHARHVVQGEHGIAREALEQAVLDHRARAAEVFLVGLEDQVEGAVEVAAIRQRLGGGQQDGGVAVVAARVHLARDPAGIGQARCLDHGQRIHVGADAQAAPAVAQLQLPHHAALADAGVHLEAPAFQQGGHQLAGGANLEAELGLGVDLAADADKGLGIDLDRRQQVRQQLEGRQGRFAGHVFILCCRVASVGQVLGEGALNALGRFRGSSAPPGWSPRRRPSCRKRAPSGCRSWPASRSR